MAPQDIDRMKATAAWKRDGTVHISVSIVTYNTPLDLLRRALESLHQALCYARTQSVDVLMQVLVVDNSPNAAHRQRVSDFVRTETARRFDGVECWHPGSNIGYGAAHNQALECVDSQFHLILNPDVEMDRDALYVGLECLQTDQDVVAVSPRARDSHGQAQYLCKRYPSVLVLGLRAFGPSFLKERYRSHLHSYEMRDECGDGQATDVPLISGCCMFVRTPALREVGCFSPSYFMYFEDFDLSLRLQPQGRLRYLPNMGIVHHGGDAARKGLWHVALFLWSGLTFFRRHDWRWV